MATTNYSHAFLVGNFNGELTPDVLDKDHNWTKEVILNSPLENEKRYERDKGYDGLCTLYYKAHLDAMIEGENIKRPKFLNSVHHYIYDLSTKDDDQDCNKITLPLKKGKNRDIDFEYTFILCKLHLFFFPLDIVLFAIEIDDTETELDNLTAAHFSLMGYWDADSFKSQELSKLMKPLTNYLDTTKNKRFTKDGNKLKIFQTIKVDTEVIEDDLLYELGTSSPIGCINTENRPDKKPSGSYLNMIMDENVVSTFDNWKGLALVDSFTILGKLESFNEDDCNFLYFPLIYLRCLFEKTFCFSRNNVYRENKAKRNLSREITMMEKYYFYENISYNFQPNLLYKAMSKGLGIKEEREELAKQIKEKDEKNNYLLLNAVSVFAIFSVLFDFYSLIKAWCEKATFVPSENLLPKMNIIETNSGELPIFAFVLSILAIITTVYVIWYLYSQRRK